MNTWSVTLITITLMTVTPGFEIGMIVGFYALPPTFVPSNQFSRIYELQQNNK